MKGVMDILSAEIYEQSIQAWVIAVGLFVLINLVFLVIRRLLVDRALRRAEQKGRAGESFTASVLRQTNVLFIVAIAVWIIGTFVLLLPEEVDVWVRKLVLAVVWIQLAFWVTAVVTYFVNRRARIQAEENAGSITSLNAFGLISKVLVWSIVILLIMENITGMKVDSLIATLGITGIAVGLAVQNILSDLFASLSITLDQPFALGDYIVVDDFRGTVENIGLKSTRLRSLSGEQLVFSNSDLLSSRIRNYKRMARRRITFTLGITYQTPYEKLAGIPEIIKDIIENQEHATLDRAHFKEYADSALVYEIVYFMETPDYYVYMDTQQAINLEIYRQFQEERIDFAYPTQTLFLETNQESLMEKAMRTP
jgi:small-conductance mechanosensitive channel